MLEYINKYSGTESNYCTGKDNNTLLISELEQRNSDSLASPLSLAVLSISHTKLTTQLSDHFELYNTISTNNLRTKHKEN